MNVIKHNWLLLMVGIHLHFDPKAIFSVLFSHFFHLLYDHIITFVLCIINDCFWIQWIIVCMVTALLSLSSLYCYVTLRLCPLTVNLSKLSSCHIRPILNDKLSISDNVLTMRLSTLHQIVILSFSLEKIARVIFSSVFSDAPFAYERLKLIFRSSFDSQKITPRVIFGWVFWRGF